MNARPLILLIFANDQQAYLDGIPKERQRLMELLRFAGDSLDLEVDEINYSTVEGVIKALNTEHERLVVLHFAGHSGTDWLKLDEGTAHANGLAAKLGECPNLKLIFLNGCNNAALVKALVDAGIPNVIGTCQSVADSTARHFSYSFFTALVDQKDREGSTITEAFRQAKTDVEILSNHDYRSLDIQAPATTPGWAWFMESSQPDWRLSDAAHPCNRLPVLPRGELPVRPFKNLYYYTEEDAGIFFGRCQAIFDVITLLDSAPEPVLLLHGGTGVGKSSFLQAGLIPRLKAPGRQQHVTYLRYHESGSQQNILEQLFGSSDLALIRARLNSPVAAGLPSIWIIDQMEEIFFAHESIQETKPSISSPLHLLLETLHGIFYPLDHAPRPNVKLVLSLRKEWFADLLNACEKHHINICQYLLEPLDKASIIEIIEGPAETNYLQQYYHLHISNPPDGKLSEKITNDLLSDKQSSIAPTLQVILSRLWERVENQHERIWDEALYLTEKKTGLLLEDYLNQQLQDIAEKKSWGKEANESGLLLDVLHAHTTEWGTAKTINIEAFESLYPHIEYRAALLDSLKDHHLIIEPQDNQLENEISRTRLAHDILAQLVNVHFDKSELPGQKAKRTLNNRKVEWRLIKDEYSGVPLDSHDLEIVKKGIRGMHDWTRDKLESNIIHDSMRQKKFRTTRNIITGILSFFLILILVAVFVSLDRFSENNKMRDVHNRYLEFSSKYMDRPNLVGVESIEDIAKDVFNLNDGLIGEKNKIIKYSILASLSLVGANIERKLSKVKESSGFAKESLSFSRQAEDLIKDYGINQGFVAKPEGSLNENRYDLIKFYIIHANLLLYCNDADQDALSVAQSYYKTISPSFFIEHKSNNDLCLEIIQANKQGD